MLEIFMFVGVGVLGGIARGLYGLLKAVNQGRVVKKGYFFMSLIVSGLIGGMLGFIFDVDYKIAGLAGYVGTDVLENIFKGSIGGNILLKRK